MINYNLVLTKSKILYRTSLFIRSFSIKSRLMFFCLMLSIIPISIIGTVSYNKASGVINEQSRTYTETVLRQIVDRVESLVQEVSKVSYIVALNPEIRNYKFQRTNNMDYIITIKTLESYFSSVISSSSYIGSIYACIGDSTLVSNNSYGCYDEENFTKFKVYIGDNLKSISPFWTGLHENEFMYDTGNGNKYVLSYTRPLLEQKSLNKYGSIVYNIPKSVMDKICSSTLESSNINLYIVDREGRTIYNRNSTLFPERVNNSYLQDILKNPEPQKSFLYNDNGSAVYVSYIHLNNSNNWVYVVEMPIDHLLQKSKDVRNITILIILISIVVVVFVSFLLATYITNPIIRLIGSMKRVEEGDFEGKLSIVSGDEIGKLTHSYNKMLHKIELLLDSVKNENALKRQAELKALQAQITPHFLYNTLNSIKYMAHMDGNIKIRDTSANLIELLQMSISNNKVFITIEEEIRLVENYLYLQSIRYEGRFRTVYEISEEVIKYKTLKLIIQPLVENSLLHGIDMKDGNGIIVVRAYKSHMGICFEVEDNGMGMSEEQLRKLAEHGSKAQKGSFSGIGVRNIDDRIKMHFGNDFGVSFKSKLGYGTTVTVTIPIITEESEYQSRV